MERADIVKAAYRAGCVVCEKWIDKLNAPRDMTAGELADFVEFNDGAPAEAIYLYAVGVDAAERPWSGADKRLQAAVCVFLASYRVLTELYRPEAQTATVGRGSAYARMRRGARRMADERMPVMGERVIALVPPPGQKVAISEAHLALPELTHDDAEALGFIACYVHPDNPVVPDALGEPVARTMLEQSYTLWFEAAGTGEPDAS